MKIYSKLETKNSREKVQLVHQEKLQLLERVKPVRKIGV